MSDKARPQFEIYRKKDARNYAEHPCMSLDDVTPVIAQGLSGYRADHQGAEVKMLYDRSGFSLTHVWFKSGYPLALHTHNSNCLYHIVAGSVRMGSEELGPGDGFYVGEDVPYTYETGPEGVEVLEFRDTNDFNIRFKTKTAKAWGRIAEQVKARQEAWAGEVPPSELAR
jgi:hypothetical protein